MGYCSAFCDLHLVPAFLEKRDYILDILILVNNESLQYMNLRVILNYRSIEYSKQ
jgi:hypothetical protein